MSSVLTLTEAAELLKGKASLYPAQALQRGYPFLLHQSTRYKGCSSLGT